MQYDRGNIFWKIIQGQVPTQILEQNAHAIAFADIHPKAKTHILVLPKSQYVSYGHFIQQATAQEQHDFLKLIDVVIAKYTYQKGRIMINLGQSQEVQHLHAHVMLD